MRLARSPASTLTHLTHTETAGEPLRLDVVHDDTAVVHEVDLPQLLRGLRRRHGLDADDLWAVEASVVAGDVD